ncbi:unnamed protein product [Alopecurus aequalis]
MLQAGSERPLPAGSMWVPGMSPQADVGSSARAREIARRRDEMLGMLHGLPESEYELSLTDLVEKTTGGSVALPPPTQPSERKEASPSPSPSPSPLGRPAARSESGRQSLEQQPAPRTDRRGSSRWRGDSGGGRSSFRSSSDGVLLNFYMPRAISRSFTAPRPGAHHAPVARAAAVVPDPDDSNKRERDSDTVKCWPTMPWDKRWRKSSRRDPAGESAAILEPVKH